MLILTVNGLTVLGPVLAQGPVSRLTVNNPTIKMTSGLGLYIMLGTGRHQSRVGYPLRRLRIV